MSRTNIKTNTHRGTATNTHATGTNTPAAETTVALDYLFDVLRNLQDIHQVTMEEYSGFEGLTVGDYRLDQPSLVAGYEYKAGRLNAALCLLDDMGVL